MFKNQTVSTISNEEGETLPNFIGIVLGTSVNESNCSKCFSYMKKNDVGAHQHSNHFSPFPGLTDSPGQVAAPDWLLQAIGGGAVRACPGCAQPRASVAAQHSKWCPMPQIGGCNSPQPPHAAEECQTTKRSLPSEGKNTPAQRLLLRCNWPLPPLGPAAAHCPSATDASRTNWGGQSRAPRDCRR